MTWLACQRVGACPDELQELRHVALVERALGQRPSLAVCLQGVAHHAKDLRLCVGQDTLITVQRQGGRGA